MVDGLIHPLPTAYDRAAGRGIRGQGAFPMGCPVFSLLGVLAITVILFFAVAITAALVLGK